MMERKAWTNSSSPFRIPSIALLLTVRGLAAAHLLVQIASHLYINTHKVLGICATQQ